MDLPCRDRPFRSQEPSSVLTKTKVNEYSSSYPIARTQLRPDKIVQAGPLMEDYSRRMITGGEYNLLPNAMLVPQELLPDHDVVPFR